MNTYKIVRFSITLAIALGLAVPAGFTALAQAPANDNFADALLITETPFDDSQTISEATTEVGEPFQFCSNWGSPGQTVWYAYTPSTTGVAQGWIENSFGAFLGVYTGGDLGSLLELRCWEWPGYFSFKVEAGQTYYLQIGSMWGNGDWMNLHLEFIPPPPNDNFQDALQVGLGSDITVNLASATLEEGEIVPGCSSESIQGSAWYMYPATETGTFSIKLLDYSTCPTLTVYQGSQFADLQEKLCMAHTDIGTLEVEANQTYYIQVGTLHGDPGQVHFELIPTPAPVANGLWANPWDPTMFDTINFCADVWDPANIGIENIDWNFGDGTQLSSPDCVNHKYASDGDYTVSFLATTLDGRSTSFSQTFQVRTHDVSITRVTAPLSASAGQTRAITVDVKNFRYPETVHTVLYKSVVGGFQEVGYLNQYVPVRSGNRTTRFTFNYTFSPEDAALGKVTFKAVAELQGARDAFPADNEAVSTPPTKVARR